MELVKIVAHAIHNSMAIFYFMELFCTIWGRSRTFKGSEATYTDQGQLVGHMVIGVQMLNEKICDVSQRHPKLVEDSLKHQLEHLIVSHHGSVRIQ